jgi:hypothetical protein
MPPQQQTSQMQPNQNIILNNQQLKSQVNLQTQTGTLAASVNQPVQNQILINNNMNPQQQQHQSQQGTNRQIGSSQIQTQQVSSKISQNAEDEAYMRKIEELRQHLPRLEKLIAKGKQNEI